MNRNQRLASACLAIALSVLAVPTMAANKFYNVTVNSVGLTGGGSTGLIQLSDTKGTPTFTNKWFTLTTTNRNEMLALAMAAVTSGLTLKVKADAAAKGKPNIVVMYLNGN